MVFAGKYLFCQNKANWFQTKKPQFRYAFLLDTPKSKVAVAPKTVMYISKSMLVQPSFYCNKFGFFCKQELKLAKVTNFKFPIAFRVGSLQYVDYLEGKVNTSYFNR